VIARASGSLGRPLASLGALEDARETSVVPSGDPRGPSGAKVMKNHRFSIGFERRTRGEPGAGSETRAARMPPGGSKVVLRGSTESIEKKMGWRLLSCTHSAAFWGVRGNPRSEVLKKHGIRSTSEGSSRRSREESGRKSADRTHSQAFWGVPTKSDQKCNTLCKIVVCRELIKSVELSAKRTMWVSEGGSGGTRGDQRRSWERQGVPK